MDDCFSITFSCFQPDKNNTFLARLLSKLLSLRHNLLSLIFIIFEVIQTSLIIVIARIFAHNNFGKEISFFPRKLDLISLVGFKLEEFRLLFLQRHMLEGIVVQQFDDFLVRVKLNAEFCFLVRRYQDTQIHIVIIFHLVLLKLVHDRL